ncbi:MAG: EMC3/TMCO1 family protein [Candidatus Bilamarchaeaceae archaeon]
MDFSTYILAISLVALIYSLVVKKIQDSLIDKKEMEEVQKESKRLSAAYNEAIKRGDKKEADKIMQEQLALLPRMNKMMLGQLKPMLIIMVIFIAITWLIGLVNPFTADDITIQLNDNGKECDRLANDGVFSGCFNLNNSNYGKWVVTVIAYVNGNEIARNSTFFYYQEKTSDHYLEAPHGFIGVKTDKEVYLPGETVVITATPEQKSLEVKAVLDNGTPFKVELPFEIPLIFMSLKTFYHPTSWFILLSLFFGIVLSFVMGRFKK